MESVVIANAASFDGEAIARLQVQVQGARSASGAVITPGEARYDELRAAWNLTVDQHPALIVVVDNAAGIAAAVRFAREANLKVAVQATGHGVILPANDSMLLISSHFPEVSVNVESRTAGFTKFC